ncbi:MAG: excinuclease ABC subunit UvrA [Leptospirales bacterium]|nr:excinuclease ABC subunit UvrA [Leptospirales bacterium]
MRIQGAREHNLKNITVELPRDQLIVITGVSGSGKSSLAFDTIYAEGQRRYVESLSSYARQFLGLMEKPDVDLIEGLSPAISIEQKTTHRNPRSTVGTVTEIYDYMRLLFARAGQPYCHKCGKPVTPVAVDQIVDRVLAMPAGARIMILAPLVRDKKGEHKEILDRARKEGFVRLRVNGQMREIGDTIELDKKKRHSIELVVDRLIIKEGIRTRLNDSIETALHQGDGLLYIHENDVDTPFSRHLSCSHCGASLPELSPRLFSFNSPQGACQKCDGLGQLLEFDEELVVPDPELSLMEGAIAPWGGSYNSWRLETIHDLANELNFDAHRPFGKLAERVRQIILHGSEGQNGKRGIEFEGVIPNLTRRYRETKSDDMRLWMERFMGERPCPDCRGKRLRPEALAVRFHNETIDRVTELTVSRLSHFFDSIHIKPEEELIVGRVLKEIQQRLGFLNNVGVGYLNLSRTAGTLSGGEAQRIRLATQIGSALMGVLYILDEPSIGLHQRDNDRLLATLKNLRDMGNTVIVVEHDEDTIRAADYVVDLGPGAGVHGGEIVAAARPEALGDFPGSLTGQYLSGERRIATPTVRRPGNGKKLTIRKARENNLKSIDVEFPLGKLICVTGVSGSGKSTLVNEILYKGVASRIGQARLHPGKHGGIAGAAEIDRVICIDQEPIGRTPRSNPATYTGLFTPIRDLFASLPEAKARGYKAGRFSFNVAGGRCEHCEGAGIIKIEMHFLPDVYVSCEVCKGKRFNRETLEVKYKGKSIYDALDMTIEDALNFFENIPAIRRKLETLADVGLEYMKLGQAATTLSGGEAQRVKLSSELAKRSTGRTLYILDEPTTGLHFEDINRLLKVLHSLADRGNTMVIIEHNLDVIKTADYLIDLGPEGGDMGGEVLVAGTPEEVAAYAQSHTGKFLSRMLA